MKKIIYLTLICLLVTTTNISSKAKNTFDITKPLICLEGTNYSDYLNYEGYEIFENNVNFNIPGKYHITYVNKNNDKFVKKVDVVSKNNIDQLNYYQIKQEKFNDINEEVIYVMNEIGKLISSGVSLNNIYFYTIPSEYKLILKKQLINHKIPYEFNEKIYLIDTPIFKEYLSLLNSLDLIEAYKLLQESIKYDPLDVMGLIVNLIVT
jgi:hypothetical protein